MKEHDTHEPVKVSCSVQIICPLTAYRLHPRIPVLQLLNGLPNQYTFVKIFELVGNNVQIHLSYLINANNASAEARTCKRESV